MRRRQFFGNASEPIVENTFIGGIGGTTTTAAQLETLLGLSSGDVQLFNVDVNDNIQCHIGVSCEVPIGTFLNSVTITYFKGNDINRFLTDAFRNSIIEIVTAENISNEGTFGKMLRDCDNLKYLDIPLNYIEVQHFMGCATLAILKLRTATACSGDVVRNASNLDHFDMRNVLSFDRFNGSIPPFRGLATGCKLYVNTFLMTNNGGGLDAELQYAVTNSSAVIVDVQNETAPDEVSDLSTSSITSSSVDLDFTTPSSTNTIQHYEVWIERQDLDFWHKDRVVGRDSPKELVTATGSTISGLVSGTEYKVYLITCDEYYNESEPSNIETFTTL